MRDTSARDTNPDFVSFVVPVRSKVMAILASEVEDGVLRCSDDGMSMSAGWWKASIWNPLIGGSGISISCRPAGGRWQVTIAPSDPDWSFVLAWPSDTFDTALRASIANLRTKPGDSRTDALGDSWSEQ